MVDILHSDYRPRKFRLLPLVTCASEYTPVLLPARAMFDFSIEFPRPVHVVVLLCVAGIAISSGPPPRKTTAVQSGDRRELGSGNWGHPYRVPRESGVRHSLSHSRLGRRGIRRYQALPSKEAAGSGVRSTLYRLTPERPSIISLGQESEFLPCESVSEAVNSVLKTFRNNEPHVSRE